MAEEVQIQGSEENGKVRHPLGILGLMFITLGIYGFVWYYKVNKEMAALGQARNTDECGTNPGKSVLALFPGSLIIVPPFVSFYNASKRLNATERLTGRPQGMEPGLMLLLYILISPVAIYLMQSNFNKVLRQQAGATAPLPGAAEGSPGAEPAPATREPAAAPREQAANPSGEGPSGD